MTRSEVDWSGVDELTRAQDEVVWGSYLQERRIRWRTGKMVIRSEDREEILAPQGRERIYLSPKFDDSHATDWLVFTNEIAGASGQHTHQGGFAIFVMEGSGYSIVDGVRHDWTAGDLLILPLRPGGVEHQHFNAGDAPAKWLAFNNLMVIELTAFDRRQQNAHAAYRDSSAT
jgi:gentisate 1,2-dioxygenase